MTPREPHLHGYGLSGYRSYNASQIHRVGPLAKVHLIAGRNNSGKSNLLHFAHDTLGRLRAGLTTRTTFFPGSLDIPRDAEPGPRLLSVAVDREWVYEKVGPVAAKSLLPLIETPAFACGTDFAWFDFEATDEKNIRPHLEQLRIGIDQTQGTVTEETIALIAASIAGSADDLASIYFILLSVIEPWRAIPPTRWVDTFRQITADPDASGPLETGRGLVDSLAALQSPDFENHSSDEQKWNALQTFVQVVLDDSSARVQVPDKKDKILVSTKDRGAMPISSLGTGISQIIILAAVATTLSNHLICIEEPELHLHPTLQRVLVEYLNGETDNQYLISTHSASMLNARVATISHVDKPGAWSQVQQIGDSASLAATVSDLGNRASDLVQSDFVIWVEGPSDRIYIASWITQFDKRLIEGAHYSIMFYGGALLSHLSADDEETDDFINLLRINRNLAVIIDSDRSEASAVLNETKLRVLGELEAIGAIGWVTEGYTIENYVPVHALTEALQELYPKGSYSVPEGTLTSPLGETFIGKKSKPSKVSVARFVTQRLDIADLTEHARGELQKLTHAIRRANGLN